MRKYDDKGTAVVGLLNIVHAHGIGMLKAAGNSRFVAETLDEAFVGRQVGVHHLERAQLVERHVHRFVNHAHAALSDLVEDAVFPHDQ